MRPPEVFISQPIRSLQTMLRVLAEDDPSHPTLVPDGIYGPETTAAVAFFQRRHGLPSTGVTDQGTWDRIVSEYEPARIRRVEAYPLEISLEPGQVIRRGEHHPHVYLIQGMLSAMSEILPGIPRPGFGGILDEATADSLAAFQAQNRLAMTGQLDKVTWKHLALHYPLVAAYQENG